MKFLEMWKLKPDGKHSPNYIMLTLLLFLFFTIVLCGQSLWIPASHISNLYVRSVVLAAADGLASFAAGTELDTMVPRLRSGFLERAGLSSNVSWDSRYFNTRSSVGATPESGTELVPEISAELHAQFPADISDEQPVPAEKPMLSNVIHSREKPLKVYMFGDSQVFSLGSGLSRLSGKDGAISVQLLAIHSSGFIRADYYNWPAKLEDTLRTDAYDAAILMLGMNDYQNFYNDQGQILKKETDAWEHAYREKCRNLIDLALTSVPRLYWVGMPEVKNKGYDESLTYINSVQESIALEYSPDVLVRVSLRDTIPGREKPYTDSVENGRGGTIRVMSDDGSHFTVEGGQLVMKPLFERLSSDYLFSEVPVANLPE